MSKPTTVGIPSDAQTASHEPITVIKFQGIVNRPSLPNTI
jgi:hypothetical protein